MLAIRHRTIHAAVSGDPDGLPVVFANSLGTGLQVWDPLLPPGLRLVRYDKRGHGLSDGEDASAGPRRRGRDGRRHPA
jgi:3-oxoadipate enol-lactonase